MDGTAISCDCSFFENPVLATPAFWTDPPVLACTGRVLSSNVGPGRQAGHHPAPGRPAIHGSCSELPFLQRVPRAWIPLRGCRGVKFVHVTCCGRWKKKKKPWHFEGESEGFRQRWARPLLGPTFRKARRGEREEWIVVSALRRGKNLTGARSITGMAW